MTSYTWTLEGRRWTLDAAPRFAVESREPGRYIDLIGTFEVGEADSLPEAKAAQECRYEFEEHASDLELARMRLAQAKDRLVNRFPRAAADAALASILESLGDSLGNGPEASEPHYQEARETDIWRKQLSPVLWVVVEASANVVLEVTTPHGRTTARILVSAVELGGALGHAAVYARAAADEAEQARLQGPDEKRRAEGRLTKPEAVEWLAGCGLGRNRAAAMARELQEGIIADADGMTYSEGYWRVTPVNTEQTAR